MSNKHRMVIAWSETDATWIVDFPELPGCMTHGDTLEEAIVMAQDASYGWLKVASDHEWNPVPVYYEADSQKADR